MIVPTVGRIVWFYDRTISDEPRAAIVARVWGDRMVNLCVISREGATGLATSVILIQEGDPIPERGCYCAWMPYQVSKAKEAVH